MDFEMIAAVSAVIGVIIAVFELTKQSKDAHTSLGIQLLRDLDKHWESEEMRHYRMALSKLCLKREEGAEIPFIKILSHSDVPNFFDRVGLYLHRNILDLEFTWSGYSYYIIGYWEVLEKEINEYRKLVQDNTPFEEFEYLYKQVAKLDSRKLKKPQSKMVKSELQLFLQGESLLTKKSYAAKK